MVAVCLACILGGCVTWGMGAIVPGQSETQVKAILGPPTHEYQDGNQQLLEYMRGRMAQATHMARIGADGKLVSYEQVLSLQKFALIQPGKTNKDEVVRIVGAPSEVDHYARSDLVAWSYAFKESGVWNSLMTVYIDKNGIVTKLENGPDPLFEPGGGRHHHH
jgi:hypothetical protein